MGHDGRTNQPDCMQIYSQEIVYQCELPDKKTVSLVLGDFPFSLYWLKVNSSFPVQLRPPSPPCTIRNYCFSSWFPTASVGYYSSLYFTIRQEQAAMAFVFPALNPTVQPNFKHKVEDQQMLNWMLNEDRNVRWHCIDPSNMVPSWGILNNWRVFWFGFVLFFQTTQADSVDCSKKLLRTRWKYSCSLLTNPHLGWELSKKPLCSRYIMKSFYLLLFILMKPHKTSHGYVFTPFEV